MFLPENRNTDGVFFLRAQVFGFRRIIRIFAGAGRRVPSGTRERNSGLTNF